MRNKKNILLAEEDRMAASMMTFRLRKSGYHVDQYNKDAAEAKEYLKTRHPDIIICSFSIGGSKGQNLIKYLKEEKVFSNIPLIIITSSERRASLLKDSDLNIKQYIIKPVQPEHLVDVVASHLNKNPKIL